MLFRSIVIGSFFINTLLAGLIAGFLLSSLAIPLLEILDTAHNAHSHSSSVSFIEHGTDSRKKYEMT